jgi:hypothetical protein
MNWIISITAIILNWTKLNYCHYHHRNHHHSHHHNNNRQLNYELQLTNITHKTENCLYFPVNISRNRKVKPPACGINFVSDFLPRITATFMTVLISRTCNVWQTRDNSTSLNLSSGIDYGWHEISGRIDIKTSNSYTHRSWIHTHRLT